MHVRKTAGIGFDYDILARVGRPMSGQGGAYVRGCVCVFIQSILFH